MLPRILAPLLLIFFFGIELTESSETFTSYVVEDVSEIEILAGSTVELVSPNRPGSKSVWVIGRFESNKLLPREGRMGDMHTKRKDDKGRRLQVFTITNVKSSPGDELKMDFWYIKPEYAEQYYNDPSAYEAMHGVKPETKVITFKVKNPDL